MTNLSDIEGLREEIARIVDPIFDRGAGRQSREWALSKADSIIALLSSRVGGMKRSKLYVVCGTTGEYSDRSEWTTWAFQTEPEARAYVEFLTALRQKLGESPERWSDAYAAWEAQMRAFDPCYTEYYTGTSWFVSEVAVGPPPPTPEAKPEGEG